MAELYPITENYSSVVEAKEADCNWYALRTRYQHERFVAGILQNKGFEIFLPLYTARHQWQDRIKKLSLPLFPSYLFVQEGLDRWLQIVSTPGVCNIVGCGGVPAAIPLTEIERVRRIVESECGVEPYPFLKTGDWVRLKAGPLAGLEGILVRKKNSTRLVVSVEMLGKSAAVEIDGTCVERVSSRVLTIASTAGSVSETKRSQEYRATAAGHRSSCLESVR